MTYKLDNAKILVIDDMKPMLSLVVSILKVFGFKDIYAANNTEKAFQILCKEDPDLIITDWLMEPEDGLEFTQRIRRDPMSPNPYVPVLMMTGFSSQIRVEAARDMGITEFLVKPFTAEDLSKRVAQIIEKPRQFVDSGTFFGPDRRRRSDDDYGGPGKRRTDLSHIAEPTTQAEKDAADILKQLRQETKNI